MGLQGKKIGSSEECSMKLLINETEIPVIWENNDSVTEIMKEIRDLNHRVNWSILDILKRNPIMTILLVRFLVGNLFS